MDSAIKLLVIIIKHETRNGDSNVNKLRKLFNHPDCHVAVQQFSVPSQLRESEAEDYIIDNYNMIKAMVYAANGPLSSDGRMLKNWSKLPVLIIRDSSVCNISQKDLMPRIQTALDSGNGDDMMFLCIWQDECNKHADTDVDEMKWTNNPTSTQAIIYRPSGRDRAIKLLEDNLQPLGSLLNREIKNGNIKATAFRPNLINYDMDLATSQEDYMKANACLPITTSPDITSRSWSRKTWIIIAIISLLLLILLGYLIYRLMKRK